MIIQCEKCATRFKVADDKVTPPGIKVRCSKCQHVFTARPPDSPSGGTGSGSPSTPSGIFSTPEAAPPSSSSGKPSSGSLSVPQVSLAMSSPGFDPFAPPSSVPPSSSSGPASGSLSSGLGADGGASLFGDLEEPGRDHSFFGPPNQTIGGGDADEDEDEVPVPPPAAAASGFSPFEADPFPPPSAPTPDPFAAGVQGGGAFQDPFAAPPSADGDKTAAFVDPFATASGPSTPSAIPPGGDPFGGPVVPDPFAGEPGPAGVSDDAFGGDPFAQGPPPAAPAPSFPLPETPSSSSSSAADDPFAGLGVEVDDAYVPAEEPTPPPPTPTPPPPAPVSSPPPSTPTPAAVQAPPSASAAPSPRRRRRYLPPALPRLLWAALQACILLTFMTLSLVWVRGGSIDDIAEGKAFEVVLARASSPVEGQGGLRVEDVVVTRRPLEVAPDLVVVSGFVVAGDTAQLAARVSVRLGEDAFAEAWANAKLDGVDLAQASNAEELLALNRRVPDEPGIEAGARAPFAVVLVGAPDGAKAEVNVTGAKPPGQAASAGSKPSATNDDKGKKARRGARRSEGASSATLEDATDPARARPRAKRASREPVGGPAPASDRR